MGLHDPVAVYNAANNVEALLVQNALRASGIEAYVTEDLTTVGGWVGGLIPEIHKPQVWAERADVERVKPVLDEFERRLAERRHTDSGGNLTGPDIEVDCEECGGSATFPAVQRGTVQQCPHCGAYLDVGDEELSDESLEPEAEEDLAEEP